MKPFNLEEAMAGKPVQTRDGREVSQLKFFEDVNLNFIVGVVSKNIWTWNMKGQCDALRGESDKDLFMATGKKSIWVNVYQDSNGKMWVGNYHNSKKEAENRKTDNCLKTIEITNEP